jgi:hypothetical protein
MTWWFLVGRPIKNPSSSLSSMDSVREKESLRRKEFLSLVEYYYTPLTLKEG